MPISCALARNRRRDRIFADVRFRSLPTSLIGHGTCRPPMGVPLVLLGAYGSGNPRGVARSFFLSYSPPNLVHFLMRLPIRFESV